MVQIVLLYSVHFILKDNGRQYYLGDYVEDQVICFETNVKEYHTTASKYGPHSNEPDWDREVNNALGDCRGAAMKDNFAAAD